MTSFLTIARLKNVIERQIPRSLHGDEVFLPGKPPKPRAWTSARYPMTCSSTTTRVLGTRILEVARRSSLPSEENKARETAIAAAEKAARPQWFHRARWTESPCWVLRVRYFMFIPIRSSRVDLKRCVVNDTVDAAHFAHNAIRDTCEYVVWHREPIRRSFRRQT